MIKAPSHLFDNIEKHEYLNKLYEGILFNYSAKLLNTKANLRVFSIPDALQFADSLSKSDHPINADKHKGLAQEMVALLQFIYPDDTDVAHTLSAVLSNVGNYRGMKLKEIDYHGGALFDDAYDKFSRAFVSIPASPNEYFFRSQKIAYDGLSAPAFSYSGPTSLGKSFIMRMFIKKQVLDGVKQNFAIIVPTKALINEVSRKLIKEDLQDNLSKFNYKVVKFADQLTLKKDGNFIFVLTPERLLYLLMSQEDKDLRIDYLFIDEAHKISSKDKRSTFYYKVVGMFYNRTKPRFIFASQNIPNPDVYLKLVPQKIEATGHALATSYSPVSQIKYIVDFQQSSICYYNPFAKTFPKLTDMSKKAELLSVIHRIGKGKQNLIYVGSTDDTVDYARAYAVEHAKPNFSADFIAFIKAKEKYKATPQELLSSLASDIRSEVHKDCFLAGTIIKGVAYHIGYLPASICMRIEELYEDGVISTLFCTSTLIEGVNLPADNLFITSYWNGGSHLTQVEFRNLVGRVGRIAYNLYGNVFLLRLPEKPDAKIPRNKREKFEQLLTDEVPKQELSVMDELSKTQKRRIVACLADGNISLLYPHEVKLPESYELMRKFAQILKQDILKDRNSIVRRAFDEFITLDITTKIKAAFEKYKDLNDDDINTSVDQAESLRDAISGKHDGVPLAYSPLDPEGKIDFTYLLAFLKRLLVIFKWDKYDSSTLGKSCKNYKTNRECRRTNQCYYCRKQGEPYKQLGWYAVILSQWLQSKGCKKVKRFRHVFLINFYFFCA